MHAGVSLVNLTDATGQNEKGVLLLPVRVDPTGTTPQPVTLSSSPAVTLLSAAISASSSGANQLVAADATKKIKVVAITVSFSGNVNVKLQSASTDLTGLIYGVANAGFGSSIEPPNFLFTTAINEALNLNLSTNVAVGGWVTYYLAT